MISETPVIIKAPTDNTSAQSSKSTNFITSAFDKLQSRERNSMYVGAARIAETQAKNIAKLIKTSLETNKNKQLVTAFNNFLIKKMNQQAVKTVADIDTKLPFLKVLAFYYKPTSASSAKDIENDIFKKAIDDKTVTKSLINVTSSVLDEIESGAEYHKNKGAAVF